MIEYLLITFVMIPLAILAVFGIEDKTADFFENGDGVTAEYKVIYNKQSYHLGEMVPHFFMIGVVAAIFGFISWLAYEGIKVLKTE